MLFALLDAMNGRLCVSAASGATTAATYGTALRVRRRIFTEADLPT